jgi:hypothetical protein
MDELQKLQDRNYELRLRIEKLKLTRRMRTTRCFRTEESPG